MKRSYLKNHLTVYIKNWEKNKQGRDLAEEIMQMIEIAEPGLRAAWESESKPKPKSNRSKK